jgi:hypothetical protein
MRLVWSPLGRRGGAPGLRRRLARLGRLVTTLAVTLALVVALEHLAVWVYSILFPPGLDAPWDKVAVARTGALRLEKPSPEHQVWLARGISGTA